MGRRERGGTLLMIAGIMLIMGAMLLTACNERQELMAQERSEAIETVIDREVIAPVQKPMPAEAHGAVPAATAQPLAELAMEIPAMQTVTVDGLDYIGRIELPALELALPVLAEGNRYELNTAPGLFCGSVYTDDIIIAAHNYRRHFGSIDELVPGDGMVFTDVLGTEHEYTVLMTETVGGRDTAAMLAGDWDLTLYTCTYGGSSRIAVRFVRCDRVVSEIG